MVGTKSLGYLLIIATIAGLLAVALFPPIEALEARPPEKDRSILTHMLEAVSSERMLADIRALSGPEFNGRQTGTPDDRASAEFVEARFASLRNDLTPASMPRGSSIGVSSREWMQAQPISFTTIGDSPTLQLSIEQAHPPTVGSDYLPVLDSPSADLSAPILFVGYGIADPENGLDEYAAVDARDKIVLFLRGKPGAYKRQVSHSEKVRAARRHGAIGYLTATGPLLNPYEAKRGVTGRPTAFYGQVPADDVLPGAWISTELASAILSGNRATVQGDDRLRLLQQRLNESAISQSLLTAVSARLMWHSTTGTGMLHNVGWFIEGTASDASTRTIVIGAHRDHFGRQAGLFFAGADDNASGTAVLLEVARLVASTPAPFARSILFLSFSGEEQGLLGSRQYVANPLLPLGSTAAMINVDHAGIGNGRLTVGVTGIDKEAAQQAGEVANLAEQIDLFGYFPGGDHVPFMEAGIPTVTVVSGGVHPHFHQPDDQVETLDPTILTAVARYVVAVAWQLASAP
jgi:hypothetical protein